MTDPTQCHNGHAFTPGLSEDADHPDPRWCNVCGETVSEAVRKFLERCSR